MEEVLPSDEEGQNAEVLGGGANNDDHISSPESDNGGFDADMFASLMKEELIAYSMSWEPLMKVLQALGRSMAKQQLAQQNNSNTMKEMENQLSSLRDELARAESDKMEAATAVEKIQNKMEEMQAQLDVVAPQDGEDQQQLADEGDPSTSPNDEGTNGENESVLDVKQSPRSPRTSRTPRLSSVSQNAFVTPKELADAKKELRNELKKALAQAFGQEAADGDDENGENSGASDGTSSSGFKLSGAPFDTAADVQAETVKLKELQARIDVHGQELDELKSNLSKLNHSSSQMTNASAETSVAPSENASFNSSGDLEGLLSSQQDQDRKLNELGASTSAILDELKELRAIQDDRDQKLREYDETMDKHKADIKSLTDGLDDLNVQQQTMSSMYASRGPTNEDAEGGNGKDVASDADKSTKSDKSGSKAVEATSQPQLDLSLVFTKLADLRRSTDASLNDLQKTIKGVSGTTQSQQEQLDALRNNVVFTEHLHVHLVEARLSMQKELLGRNQTFQDRTKPQLAEWRKALELTEDKLLQGNSDDESLHALQQMQRCYHRTLLSIAPLVNSPLSIAETLQTLSDEVKQLQNAVRLGVVPLRITDDATSGEGTESKDEREEEYTRKLRYLDEEIDATLQVNITTEKKNDPLIKGLDAMREKLELLWSMWHRNYNVDHDQASGSSPAHDDANANTATSSSTENTNASHDEHPKSIQQRNPDSLREIELRLMGAVRRLAMVEEDVEKLKEVTAGISSSDRQKSEADAVSAAPNRRAPSTNNLRTELVMEEMDKLRKELYAEVARITAQHSVEGSGGGSSNNNHNTGTSLIPMERRSMVESASKQGDVLTDLFSQMTGRELDGRLYSTPEGQKQFYDNFIKEVTKKVALNLDKTGARGPGGPGLSGAANANVNYRMLLDNFAQKVDDRLEDAREFTAEEMARLRRELLEQLKLRFEVALRDLRGELMLLQPTDGDSTAMGTKPVMCVACSRPVPVSSVIREAGSLPPAESTNTEQTNPVLPIELDYDRPDDDFVFRAGFKMPASDRKVLTLPFLTTAMRSKMVLNKPEGKRKRPVRQTHLNRVDNVVREAMELDRVSRGRGFDASQS